ncbi:hypothetical protein LUZ60_009626 [Juncus effusus]|nr:hypothetical protein LUZ60_009626 [Juncus effusus]
MFYVLPIHFCMKPHVEEIRKIKSSRGGRPCTDLDFPALFASNQTLNSHSRFSPSPIMAGDESPTRRLRQRWELAAVLDFLHVFEPLMKSDLGLSAEEIEKALISPNNDLAKLHIVLIKGIPPLPKNLKEPNAWISNTSKKLAPWWKWVAEGENPLKPDHGKEIEAYTQLDPIARLLILKALCELRGEQEDVLRYVTDEIKAGISIKNFRSESIGTNGNGSTYWYTGDSVIGYRLYKEEIKVEFPPRLKANGQLIEQKMDIEWETVATNLDEFSDITEKFLSSGVREQIALGERIKEEILPSLEALVKKKERKIKRQQREAMMLEAFRDSIRTSKMRRARKHVSYTYDDYDQRINEAIKEAENDKDSDSQEDSHSPTGDLQSNNSTSSTGDEQNMSDTSQDEKEKSVNINKPKATKNPDKNENPNLKLGLRRSQRNAGTSDQLGNTLPEAKKRLRQRPVINSGFNNSDSDENSEDYKKARVSDSESE